MSEVKKDSKNVRFTTPFFRVSFPNVFKPKAAFQGQEPTYNVQMLFAKEGKFKADLTELKTLVREVAKKKFGDTLPGTKNSPFKWPLRDGSEKELEAYKGMIFANAKSKNKPGIIDSQRNDIISPDDFYAGCYARATISIFAFAKQELGSYGVAFGLDNLQKVADGAAFSGKKAAKDDFEVIEDLGEDGDDFKNADDEQADAMDF